VPKCHLSPNEDIPSLVYTSALLANNPIRAMYQWFEVSSTIDIIVAVMLV
jgi:hypothetical protein